MIQHMIESRLRKKTGGTTQYASKIVEDSRESLQEQQEQEEKQQLEAVNCFEDAKLDENRRKHIMHVGRTKEKEGKEKEKKSKDKERLQGVPSSEKVLQSKCRRQQLQARHHPCRQALFVNSGRKSAPP